MAGCDHCSMHRCQTIAVSLFIRFVVFAWTIIKKEKSYDNVINWHIYFVHFCIFVISVASNDHYSTCTGAKPLLFHFLLDPVFLIAQATKGIVILLISIHDDLIFLTFASGCDHCSMHRCQTIAVSLFIRFVVFAWTSIKKEKKVMIMLLIDTYILFIFAYYISVASNDCCSMHR
jgi:hypothetical protein